MSIRTLFVRPSQLAEVMLTLAEAESTSVYVSKVRRMQRPVRAGEYPVRKSEKWLRLEVVAETGAVHPVSGDTDYPPIAQQLPVQVEVPTRRQPYIPPFSI